MHGIQSLLMELDRLKSVRRRAYLSDSSRNENSAEHSWHLAVAILALKEVMQSDVNINHAVRIALVHDVCEIGAGDVSIYSPDRCEKTVAEREYISRFASEHKGFAFEVEKLWLEYEEQKTPESRWVKVVDRLLPFLMNLATEGRTWKEQNIKKSQVVAINKVVADEAPIVYQWMTDEIDKAVELGWLKNA